MMSLNIRNLILARGVQPKDVRGFIRDLGFEDSVAKGFASGARKTLTTHETEVLCYKLKVDPNQLFLWSPDRKHPFVEGHPINIIKAGAPLPDIIADAKDLPVEELHKVHEYIEQLKGKSKK